MDAKLVVVSGSTKASKFNLRIPALLGRGREATLMLPHPLVSRRHCEIVESNGYLVVRDMGSLNGTFVNNKRVTEAVLPPGGLLTLGSVTFQAVYDASPAGATRPAAVPAAVSPAAVSPAAVSPAAASPAAASPAAASPAAASPKAVTPKAVAPKAVAPKAIGGDIADLGDFEILEVFDTPRPTGGGRPPKRVARRSPLQPDNPPQLGPFKADDDLGDDDLPEFR